MSITLLKGRVGSHAYGLATEGSDEDWLAVHAVPTEALFTLDKVNETTVTKDPDSTSHEARKYCALAMECNPTALELLWLDDYDTVTAMGSALIDIRTAFLSRDRVRDAYLGYAKSQLHRMDRKPQPDERTEAEALARVAKNARHMARLLLQAQELELALDCFTVRLKDPDWVRGVGERAAAGDRKDLWSLLEQTEALFARPAHLSTLPPNRDRNVVNGWLTNVRLANLTAERVP